MKKLISIVLCMLMCVSLLPVMAVDEEVAENLALTATVSAMNDDLTIEGRSTREATLGNDGDLSTFWMAYLSSATITQYPWYKVDLGSAYNISQIKMQARRDTSKSADRKNFEVQLSNDPEFATYVVAASQGTSSYAYKEYWSADITADQSYRYIRIMKTALENLSISEFEVYAQATSKPIAFDPIITGSPIVKQEIKVDYTFIFEGAHSGITSTYTWYASDDREGLVNSVEVHTSVSNEYEVEPEYVGKYLTCVITPSCIVDGVTVTGNPVRVVSGKLVRATATEPSGVITAPANGDIYSLDEAVNLAIEADSGDSQVAKVEYYIDGAKYSESTVAPYGSAYTNATLGDHDVYAVITNVLGEMFTTSAVSFNVTESENTYEKIGVIHKRDAKEIDCDWFSIGCECLDRDMAIYDNYKEYLGPLGITKARIQGGWAKCEKEKGVYSWEWLDDVVYDMIDRGVTPWINTCYGNALYEGGGGTTLSGGLPYSEEALAAWDKWVDAMVRRYKHVVKEWEVWNEADHGDANTMSDYTTFFIRTSDVIKNADPDAKVIGLAASSSASSTLKSFMNKLKDRGRLDTIDHVTVHGYSTNPDDNNNYTWTNVIKNYSTAEHPITIWCGETGLPDRSGGAGALGGFNSSQMIQSKWVTRRLLDARSKDVVISYYTMIDLMYKLNDDGSITQNVKGLIRINEDMSVKSIKPAYYTLQNLASVFDNSLNVIPNYTCTTSETSRALHVTGYEKTGTGKQVIATWFKDATPTNSTATTPITYTVENGNFDNPVYVDLRTGDVYNIRKWEKNGDSYTFYYIPVYDSAILIADASTFEIDYDEQFVSSPVIVDQNDKPITTLDSVTTINASSLINGTVEDDLNLNMIIALYDDKDTLIAMSFGEGVNAKGENVDKNISASITLDETTKKAKKIKVFVWDVNSQTEYLTKASEILL